MDIKDLFNNESVAALADALQQSHPAFERETFLARVFDADWPGRELKQRIRHITAVLHDLLPAGLPGRARHPAAGHAGRGGHRPVGFHRLRRGLWPGRLGGFDPGAGGIHPAHVGRVCHPALYRPLPGADDGPDARLGRARERRGAPPGQRGLPPAPAVGHPPARPWSPTRRPSCPSWSGSRTTSPSRCARAWPTT